MGRPSSGAICICWFVSAAACLNKATGSWRPVCQRACVSVGQQSLSQLTYKAGRSRGRASGLIAGAYGRFARRRPNEG